MRVTGGGLSPDGTQVALILADQDDPDGHLLLVADITANGSVRAPHRPGDWAGVRPERRRPGAPSPPASAVSARSRGPMPLSSTASAPTRSFAPAALTTPLAAWDRTGWSVGAAIDFTRIDLFRSICARQIGRTATRNDPDRTPSRAWSGEGRRLEFCALGSTRFVQ